MNSYEIHSQTFKYLDEIHLARFGGSYFEVSTMASRLISYHGEPKIAAMLQNATKAEWVAAMDEADAHYQAQIPALLEAEKRRAAAWAK